MGNHKVTEIHQYNDPLIHFNLFLYCDYVTFEDVVKNTKWQKAMNDKIDAFQKNNTSKLMKLPKKQKDHWR